MSNWSSGNIDYVTYSYDPLGRPTQKLLGSSVISSLSFDPQPPERSPAFEPSWRGVLVYTGHMTVGNRLSRPSLTERSRRSLTSDSSVAERAQEREQPYNITYAYEPSGESLTQVLRSSHVTYNSERVDPRPHARAANYDKLRPERKYVLDTQAGIYTYTWDSNNRLTLVSSARARHVRLFRRRQAAINLEPIRNPYSGNATGKDKVCGPSTFLAAVSATSRCRVNMDQFWRTALPARTSTLRMLHNKGCR